MSSVKRTYASKPNRDAPAYLPSSPRSESASSPPHSPSDRKRRVVDGPSVQDLPAAKKRAIIVSSFLRSSRLDLSPSANPKRKAKKAATKEPATSQSKLTQLHFSLDTTVLRTCALCSLTYTKGAPDDESLHRAHCARVQRGMEWGKEEERECKSGKISVEEIEGNIKLKKGSKGRIICFRTDVGGKIGAKLATLLGTINITLSAPALTQDTLHTSKAYLFLLSAEPNSSTGANREKIVGCVIAQRIVTAMAVAPQTQPTVAAVFSASSAEDATSAPTKAITSVSTSSDSSSITLIPKPLPTPLGISRLFVSSSHRRLGIGSRLLTAAALTFIHGCPLDPKKGEVAFSQPTGLGGKVMEKWTGGKGRVFEET
ncbi:hypothetical protein BDW22DRAFT_1358630 [Trametopsis cervina]|nr:hypothetical protein BDW22DRAFT_1358630 [Trametopsis cervina]